jgi:hypothetical protein
LTFDALARQDRRITETAATPTRAVASTWAVGLTGRSTPAAASHPSGFAIGPSSKKPPGWVLGSSARLPMPATASRPWSHATQRQRGLGS